MKAIILAAGCGQRLMPLTREMPKCLLQVNGRSLLEWQLDALATAGITEVCIVTGHGADKIPRTLKTFHNPDYATTNMVASLFCASAELSDDCLLCYSDILYEPRILHELLSADAGDIAVVVDRDWREYYQRRFSNVYAEAESLVLRGKRIIDIGRDTPSPSDVQGRYVGLIRLSRAGAKLFTSHFHMWRGDFWERAWYRGRSLRNAYMTDFLQALIDSGVEINAVPVSHGWLEFDDLEDYRKAVEWSERGALDPLLDFHSWEPGTAT